MGIEASRCNECGRAIVPPRIICPYCGRKAGDMIPLALSNQGTVLSYTLLHLPPNGFDPPVFLALVEMDYKAVVLCSGDPKKEYQIKIGSKVSVIQDTEGLLHFSPIAD